MAAGKFWDPCIRWPFVPKLWRQKTWKIFRLICENILYFGVFFCLICNFHHLIVCIWLYSALPFFTVLQQRGLATRKLSVCLSVRPSVHPSVKCVDCDTMEEKSAQIFIPYEGSFSLVFWEKEWLVGTPSTWNIRSTDPCWSEIADFKQIIALSASAVTLSEQVQLTIGSQQRAFQWAYLILVRCP